jgi:hypothetical protein
MVAGLKANPEIVTALAEVGWLLLLPLELFLLFELEFVAGVELAVVVFWLLVFLECDTNTTTTAMTTRPMMTPHIFFMAKYPVYEFNYTAAKPKTSNTCRGIA